MNKTTFPLMVLILGLSISSYAQTKDVLTQDKINAKTINTPIVDSQTISQCFQIKPCKFNPITLDGPMIIVIDGKVSENVFNRIDPKNIQSISVLKGEKAYLLNGNKDASGVIIVTTKRAAHGSKVENEPNKK